MPDSMAVCVLLGFVLCLATIGFFSVLNLATDYILNNRTEKKIETLNQLVAHASCNDERNGYLAEIKRLRKKMVGLK